MHLYLPTWLAFNVPLRARESIQRNSFLYADWERGFLNVSKHALIFDKSRSKIYLQIKRESMHVCMQLSREFMLYCCNATYICMRPGDLCTVMY